MSCVLLLVVSIVGGLEETEDCSLSCSSVLLKCRILGYCDCYYVNIPLTKQCHVECKKCLDFRFDECCGCIGMCDHELKEGEERSRSGACLNPSHDLFTAFINKEDQRYLLYKYDKLLDLNYPPKIIESLKKLMNISGESKWCKVVYWNKCLVFPACIDLCQSIKSYGYRFFVNGCCECIGEYCIGFGSRLMQCRGCPSKPVYAGEL